MNAKKVNKKFILIGLMIFLVLIHLSGCIDEQNNQVEGENHNKQSDDEISNNNQNTPEDSSDNSNNNQESSDDSDMFIGTWVGSREVTQSGPRGEMVLEITRLVFIDENQVEIDESSSQKGSRVSRYSYEINGNTLNFDGERASYSFDYSFDEGYDVLYLDGSKFMKN